MFLKKNTCLNYFRQNKGCSSPETGFFTDSTLNGRVTLTSEGGIYECKTSKFQTSCTNVSTEIAFLIVD